MPKIAAIVVLDTANPTLLYPEPHGRDELRAAVIEELPHLTRVLAVLSEEVAEFLLAAHVTALDATRSTEDEVLDAFRSVVKTGGRYRQQK